MLIPLEKQAAVAQIERLNGLDGYPKKPTAEAELVSVLMRKAPNMRAAQRFVDDWLRNERKCPKPVDIHEHFASAAHITPRVTTQYLRPLAPGEDPPPPEYSCRLCEDSGWVMVQLPEVIPGTSTHYTTAKRCHHPAREL